MRAIRAMLPERIYILRAQQHLELADKAASIETRNALRWVAVCWPRMAEDAQRGVVSSRTAA